MPAVTLPSPPPEPVELLARAGVPDRRQTSAPPESAGPIRLLDHLPDLSADLEPAQAAAARRALAVPSIRFAAGQVANWRCTTEPPTCGTPFGLVVIDGLLAREVTLGGRSSTSLYGPGDVFQLGSDEGSSLGSAAIMTCPDEALIAVLDDRLLAAMREWPRMIARLTAIVMGQLERADVNAAIGRLERVEDRLLGFFWLLADRWGRIGQHGIAIEQPLTHEAIGHLIGARRPTVSLGLRALADEGTLVRSQDGTWLLAAASLDHLMAARTSPALAVTPIV